MTAADIANTAGTVQKTKNLLLHEIGELSKRFCMRTVQVDGLAEHLVHVDHISQCSYAQLQTIRDFLDQEES